MRHKKATKSSVVITTDEPCARLAVKEILTYFGKDYEFEVVETTSVIVAEFFLGTNLPAAERACMIGEIFAKFDSTLEAIEKG